MGGVGFGFESVGHVRVQEGVGRVRARVKVRVRARVRVRVKIRVHVKEVVEVEQHCLHRLLAPALVRVRVRG